MVVSRSSGSASARNPTRPWLTPSSGTPASRAISAARRIVPSPPSTRTSSAPAAEPRSPLHGVMPVMPSSRASASSTRTSTPASCSRDTTRSAAWVVASRPVCTSSSTDRVTAGTLSLRARLDRRPQRVLVERRCTAGQPQEVLDVSARAGQWAGGHPAYAETERCGLLGDPTYGLCPKARISYDAAGGQPVPAHLELRLHHGQQVDVRRAAGQ